MRHSLLFLGMTFCCVLFVAADRPASAQQAPLVNVEYQLKAGYFAYFGHYVTWPQQPFAGADKKFVIGILGRNPFAQNLRQAAGGFLIDAGKVNSDKIQDKKITVVQYKSVADFQRNYKPCHILFICRSSSVGVQNETAAVRVKAALKQTAGQPVLLVAEALGMNASKKLAKDGAMICYWNNNQTAKVHMIVNRAALRQERLDIRARLLQLHLVTLL